MKKLDFVCPICGGRLISCVFKSGTDDYYVSKNGKQYSKPFKKASSQLTGGDGIGSIVCQNYFNNTCDFVTDFELDFDNEYKYKYKIVNKIVNNEDIFELYDLEEE